jgi:tetraprenyl-beta-curcumene synthase
MTSAGTGRALVLANVRYWSRIAPQVRAELQRWEQRAAAIPNPALRTLALTKLREERFNTETAGTLATLAPRAWRQIAVEAIVALEVMYDYLDGLTEQPVPDPLLDGRALYLAFTDAVTPGSELSGDYYRHRSEGDDGGYLVDLACTVRGAVERLPAAAAVGPVMRQSADRCAEAQVRVHASALLGNTQLEQWARSEAAQTGLQWREFLAGAAASVLGVHALIAAAADSRTSAAHAAQIDMVYLSIGALATILDSLVDYERDRSAGESAYIDHYADWGLLAQRLESLARSATVDARALPRAAHHTMMVVGVVAYYSSAPAARGELVRPVLVDLHRQLRPLIAPTMAVLRGWRLAKHLRRRSRWW